MQINTSQSVQSYTQSGTVLKEKDKEFKDKIDSTEISAKTLSQAYLLQYSLTIKKYSADNLEAQSAPFDLQKIRDILDTIDFKAIGYTGKAIQEMTPQEAASLVSEDGFFGVSQTSTRLSDFVLNGGGDDIDKLKAGREGIIRGFNEAEQIWGQKLPDISYETLDKALAKIDEKITALGGKILDTNA